MRLLLPLALIFAATPALAHPPIPPAELAPPKVAPETQARIDQLPAIIGGTGDFDNYFIAAFRNQVPKAQFDEIGRQLRAQYGAVQKVEDVKVVTRWGAIIRLGFEKGVATINMSVDPAAPHLVTGLRIANVEPRNDDAAKVEADFRALPGKGAFGVYALGNGIRPLREVAGTDTMPLGSAFKLWILAEAARQVQAGEREWSDVVTLGQRSLPSGTMQSWPKDAPVTLQTLATLMIAISDNTATDNLLITLGRAKVDAMVPATGVANPAATLPVLTTMEAFQLKSPANADLATAWRAAGPDGRRRLLRDNRARLAATKIDAGMFGDKPLALDVEWFASPRDEAAVLDWLRTKGGDAALAILAVNPGTPHATLFDYAGFKGGSEPGVIFGSWLVKTKKGNWYAVTGGWTRPDTAVETLTFMSLMNRVLAQVATQ
jgi:hypothetical protein